VRPTLLLNEDHPGVREYAAQKEIDEQAALETGMKEKAEEFVAAGESFIKAVVRPEQLRGFRLDCAGRMKSANERRRRGILVAPGGAKRNPGITSQKLSEPAKRATDQEV
jgi:hypothetical protein